QSAFGRTGNLGDAVNNGLGITAFLLMYWGWRMLRSRRTRRAIPRFLLATAGVLLAIAWWTPIALLRDERAVQSQFPSLATFESRMQLSRFYFRECVGELSSKNVTEGNRSMEVIYQPTPHPAATLVELKADWSGMKTLEIDVTLDASYPDSDARFMIKVIDELHQTHHTDTYRGEWTLLRGKTQRISISRNEILNGPDDRQSDLTKIQYVDLMLLAPVETAKVRFDAMRLTQSR
ncbi:MAG: hypothetical protein AB8B91_11640, partial [Rubripirellula sp.]